FNLANAEPGRLLGRIGPRRSGGCRHGPAAAGPVLTIVRIRRDSIVTSGGERIGVRLLGSRTLWVAQAARRFLVAGAGAGGECGSGSGRCRQESPSMSRTWQCWVKRSTSATTQAAMPDRLSADRAKFERDPLPGA